MKTPLCALALLALVAPGAATADTLISNVNGLRVGADGQIHRFNALLIDDSGKVKSPLEGPPPPTAFKNVVDGKGMTLMPGLIDGHGHVIGLGQALLSLALVGASSLDDMKARLKTYAAANPDLKWIVGHGWNQELWPAKAFPTAPDLDSIVADRPVVLTRVDGHALIANSKAMELAKFSAATPVPSGGRIENGLFVDAAMGLIDSVIPDPTPADLDAAFTASQKAMLAVGLTAVADMGTDVDDWAAYRRAGDTQTLKVRIFGYAGGLANWEIIHDGVPTGWEYADRLALVGVKLYADGALGSRGAFLKAPYSDKPDTRGLSLITPYELLKQADKVAEGGGQLAVHAIGDAANAEVITVFEKIGAKYGRYHRPRIEHFQIADPKDIARLKPAGIVASMQPVHQTSDRLMAEARLGPNRLGGAYAWRTIEKLGIPLAFGSDFPVESPNPFPGLAAAISRQDMAGQPKGGWRPEQKLSITSALGAYARGAAYAGFAEDKFGSLEPGTWADFILIDRDPTKVDAQALARTKVLETWVAGEQVFSAEGEPAPAR
ncbi:MAG: amidohydrolase family protein [Sphingomicrobium sp.]